MFLLASFSRRRLMCDRNAPKGLRWPNNSWAERATVRMTLCFLADCTVLHVKLVAARGSMVDAPGLDIASHTSVAKWTPVNRTFLFNNAILHRKSVPTATDPSMVYLPCRHVTGHMPITRGTNVIARFRKDASFLDSEKLTACVAVIYLACAYIVLVIDWSQWGHTYWKLLPSLVALTPFVGSVAFSVRLLSSCVPRTSASPSVVISVPFSCLRCFAFGPSSFVWGFSCSLFRFRSGMAAQTSAMACAFFSSAAVTATDFGLRCSYPLHRFSDTSPGKGRFQQLPQTWSPLQERGCASPDSKAHAACFTLHTLHLHQPHAFPSNPSTLYRHCVAVSTPRQKISFRPCAYCRHYTIVCSLAGHTHTVFFLMWLVKQT